MLHVTFFKNCFTPKWYHKVPVVLFVLVSAAISMAQTPYIIDDPTEPYEAPDPSVTYQGDFNPNLLQQTCYMPKVVSQSVIHYNSFIQVRLTFQELNGLPLTLNIKGMEATSVTVAPVENQLVLNNLSPNVLYEIRGINSCGKTVIISSFSTYQYNRGNGIEVSDILFRALADYTQAEGQQVGMHKFLQNLNTIDLYERIAFAQRYFLGGTPLPDNTVGSFPISVIESTLNPPPPPVNPERNCLCEFVLNQTSSAFPDQQPHNYNVDEKSWGEHDEMNKNGRWWANLQEEGAAKSHALYSDGVNNGSAFLGIAELYGIQSLDQTKSPNYANNNYHLICVGFASALPEGCSCERVIRANLGYEAEVDVRANTVSSGGGKKRSAALAEEFGVAFTVQQVGTNYQINIVDAGLVSMAARCEAGIPAQAFVDGLVIAAQIVIAIKSGLKTGDNGLSNQLSNIGNQINSYMEKYFKETECNSGSNKQTLIQKDLILNLESNKPLSIFIVSGTALTVQGKRSWKSHAKVNSSFHLASVVQGGFQNSTRDHCCSDYAAQWVWAGRPIDDPTLQGKVENFVKLHIPFTLPLTVNFQPIPYNAFSANTEIGHAVGDYSGCSEGEIRVNSGQ